jgi:hypothetical protein
VQASSGPVASSSYIDKIPAFLLDPSGHRHFEVPPSTVTRLYGRLKDEGVLGTIWGSKTVIEPSEINRDIRIKAIIGLPASLRAFPAFPNYREFFLTLQDALWKQGFGTRLLFYDQDINCPSICETFLVYHVDLVIWLAPKSRDANMISRLTDREIKSISIFDGLPINGERGIFLSQRNALVECLSEWRKSGIRSAFLVDNQNNGASSRQRIIEECLLDAGITLTLQAPEAWDVRLSPPTRQYKQSGLIFGSRDAILRVASCATNEFERNVQYRRVILWAVRWTCQALISRALRLAHSNLIGDQSHGALVHSSQRALAACNSN